MRVRLGKAGVKALVDGEALVSAGLQAPCAVASTTWLPQAASAAALSPPATRRRRRRARITSSGPSSNAGSSPLAPPMLGPLTPREAELAGSFDRGGALGLVLQDPSRLADERWFDGSIFAELTKELTVWANLFCSDVLAIGQTRWHAYGSMVYGYLSSAPDLWPASLAIRLKNRMARCQKVAFFYNTTAHWTLAVADPGSRMIRVYDSYPGRSAGQEVGLALASFFSEHLPTPPSLVEERRD
jgi:hypothetical protein